MPAKVKSVTYTRNTADLKRTFSATAEVCEGTPGDAVQAARAMVDPLVDYFDGGQQPEPPPPSLAPPPTREPSAFTFHEAETGEALDLADDGEFQRCIASHFKARKFSEDAAKKTRVYIAGRAKVARLSELSGASRLSFATELHSGQLDRFNTQGDAK